MPWLRCPVDADAPLRKLGEMSEFWTGFFVFQAEGADIVCNWARSVDGTFLEYTAPASMDLESARHRTTSEEYTISWGVSLPTYCVLTEMYDPSR